MALGKRSSENQVPTFGSPPPVPPAAPAPHTMAPPVPPPMPPPTTAPVSDVPPATPQFTEAPPPENDESQSDVVTALDARLQELQATVAALVDKSIDPDTIVHPPPAPEPEPVESTTTPTDVDPDVYESSRILQLAKRTAEALLSEAREEAAEIVRTARQRADEELDVQRRALSTDQRVWESRRKALVELFEEFDGVLGNHRTQMDRAHEMIRQALSGPISTPIALPEPPIEPAPPSGIRVEDAPAAPKAPPKVDAEVTEPNFEVVDLDKGEATDPSPPPPVFAAPEDVTEGILFGTPPPAAPVTPSDEQLQPVEQAQPVEQPQPTSQPQPAPTPFYPWAEQQQSPVTEPARDEDTPPQQPPVQRRGLFGH